MAEIIRQPEVFEESYSPKLLPGRRQQLAQLAKCVAPALAGKKPIHAVLLGPSGSGKTAAARAVLSAMESQGVPAVYVSCLHADTLYAILDQIVNKLRIVDAAKIDTAFKVNAINSSLGRRPLVVVLDEIDRLAPKERELVLCRLNSVNNCGVIFISREKHLLHSIEQGAKSRLQPMQIFFEPFSIDDLVQIAKDRCARGLVKNAISDEHLRYIAERASGNAHAVVQIIRKASLLAEQDKVRSATREHIEMASLSIGNGRKEYLLGRLNKHYVLIYELVKENPGILSGDLWKGYTESCQRQKWPSVADRTFSLYLRRLTLLSLIAAERAEGRGNIWKYQAL